MRIFDTDERRRRLAGGPVRDEQGVALLTVMMMLALLSALSLTVAVVTTNNLISARLAQQAGSGLNASDAGVAQAMTYLRQGGVRDFRKCGSTCTTMPWGTANPKTVDIAGRAGQSYTVSIKVLVPFTAVKTGRLQITSTGTAAGGARRTVTAEVAVEPFPIVFGIVASSFDKIGNPSGGAHNESVFLTGCVTNRDHFGVTGFDSVYGIPAGVHTTDIITDGNGCSDSSSIHSTGSAPNRYCNVSYPYDEDKMGGPLTGTSCFDKAKVAYPTNTHFTTSTDPLFQFPTTSLGTDPTSQTMQHKVKRPPFTQAQLDQLKAVAKSQNSYYTSATGWTPPTATDSVLYFDLTATHPGDEVNLNGLSVAPWNRPLNATGSDCPDRSLLVIIEGGNAMMNSNSQVAGSIFLISDGLYGDFTKLNGGADLTGNVFANNIKQNGTADTQLDDCFMNNVSPTLTNLRTLNYRELDR